MVQYARRIRKETPMTDQAAEAPRPAPEVRIAGIVLPNQTIYSGLHNVDG